MLHSTLIVFAGHQATKECTTVKLLSTKKDTPTGHMEKQLLCENYHHKLPSSLKTKHDSTGNHSTAVQAALTRQTSNKQ